MLKLNVGFTKKVGEANYGSRGASVNLELELDSSLVGDRLKERIRHLFGLAKVSVDEELAAGASHPAANDNGHLSAASSGSGRAAGQTNGHFPELIREWIDLCSPNQEACQECGVELRRLS